MKTEFIKQNEEPIEIEYVEDEHEAENDFKPSFWFNNRRYFMDKFIRAHNNPWIGTGAEFPEYIHEFEADNYHNPLFIEIVDGGSAVNVYKEREVTEE